MPAQRDLQSLSVEPIVRFASVSKRYEHGGEALKDVSFALPRGQMAFLTGRSGAGKSTLLRLIALLERPSRGQVQVCGAQLAQLARRQVPYHRRRVGLIFQDHRLLPDRTVFENVALPLMIAGRPAGEEMVRRVRAALDQVSLIHREQAFPPTLSGGEQQRVGIARAIVAKPELLLADEPTGNLDPALSRDIMDLFRRLNAAGTTVLVASHDLTLIRSLDKPLLVLEDGELSHVDEALSPTG
mgnify:CR=1 FL=1